MFKKALLILVLLIWGAVVMACDGTCACGGVEPPTKMEQALGYVYSVAEMGLYYVAGSALAAEGMIAAPIGIPALCVWLSRDQAKYNAAHGIHHSREERGARR